MKDNEMRHVIHDTRISSGQCPRRDVTVRYGLKGHTNIPPPETYKCQNLHLSKNEIDKPATETMTGMGSKRTNIGEEAKNITGIELEKQ
jgi:hypothetical protein